MDSIRCPNLRPHLGYNVCGRLLGAVEDGKIYLRCSDCGQFFEITIKENDLIEMRPLSKNTKLQLKSTLRAIV
jgi:hypothetical protein